MLKLNELEVFVGRCSFSETMGTDWIAEFPEGVTLADDLLVLVRAILRIALDFDQGSQAWFPMNVPQHFGATDQP